MKLNDQQHKIVNTPAGRIAVIAGAGAGKTTTTLELIEKQYLDNGVPLERMFITTFTNKAAKDVKEKLQKKLKLNDAFFKRLWLGTFHSLGYRYLTQIRNMKLNIILPVESNHYLKNIYKQVTKNEKSGAIDEESSFSDIIQSIERKRNQNCPWEDVTKFPDICQEILSIYQKEKKDQNLVDYTDILDMFADELKKDDYFRKKFDWVFVDECQDNNFQQHNLADLLTNKSSVLVGDLKQCWEENEIIPVFKEGSVKNIKAKDIVLGDNLKSLKGQRQIDFFPVTNISTFKGKVSVVIKTESGKKIEVSENHLFLAKFGIESKYHVYLMYHKDLGLRIGSSFSEFGQRARHEHANRLWLLKECSTLEEALFYETQLSLRYQIPQCLYQVGTRKIKTTNELLKGIFDEFGFKNFDDIFYDFGLDFDFPHYSSLQGTKKFIRVKLVRTSVRTSGRFEVQVDSSLESLNSCPIPTRKFYSNYKEAYKHAIELKEFLEKDPAIDVCFVESLYFEKNLFILHRAKSIKVGSKVIVENNGVVSFEKVSSVERDFKEKTFVSIEVGKSGLVINSDGIISHNSIYPWRGALPKLFKEKVGKSDYVYPLSYNYRSTKEIIDFANVMLQQVPSFGGQELISTKNSGPKPMYVICENIAYQIYSAIKDDIRNGVPLHEIAVLGRSIKPVNIQSLEVLLRRDNIPYAVRGGDDRLNATYIQNYLSALKSICSPTKVSLMNTLSLLPGIGAKTAMTLAEDAISGGIDAIRASGSKYAGTKAYNDFLNLDNYRDTKKELLLKTLDFIYEHYLVPTYGKKDPMEPSKKKTIIFDVLYEYLLSFPRIIDGIDSLYVNEEDADAEKGKIIISTIHQSKGLEWDNVYIANMNEFSLPFFTEEDEGNIDREEEEFCLAYVACTRAKKVLRMYMPFMTGSGSWSKTNKMSRYIKNMFLTSGEKYFNFRVLDVHNEIEFKNKILATAMNKTKQ